eukprot:gene32909-67214_t
MDADDSRTITAAEFEAELRRRGMLDPQHGGGAPAPTPPAAAFVAVPPAPSVPAAPADRPYWHHAAAGETVWVRPRRPPPAAATAISAAPSEAAPAPPAPEPPAPEPPAPAAAPEPAVS